MSKDPVSVRDGLERAAKICEQMVVGGRAWTEEQSIAADALFAAAKAIRAVEIDIELQSGLLDREREIVDHHDGHGLAESIRIRADGPGPGGASHRFCVEAGDGVLVADIRYQCGPRGEDGSTSGVLDSVLLAIVADRMRSFQGGPFSCRENALVLTKAEEALHWLKHRADERARRGVLGRNQK